MQHVVVQLPSAPWLARVAHTVVAAWAASVDLTLDEIDEAGRCSRTCSRQCSR